MNYRNVDCARAACDQTADHLDALVATKSLTDPAVIDELTRRLDELGRKLNLFLQSIDPGHISEK
jgi:hypothetical protein